MVYMNQKIINEIILYLLKEDCHGRRTSKELKIPLTTVQRTLSDLENKNVLESKISGKNRIYSIKKNIIAKSYIYNAESYKLIKLIKKYPFLEPLIEDIIKKSDSPLIILFGSFAKFIAKRGSDMDVFIETKNRNIKKEIENINSKLSVKIGSFNKDSLLIKEIIKNHVIIKGIEVYYEKFGFFKEA